MLPTIAAITGKSLPGNQIDGMDVSDLWLGRTERSPRTEFIHYTSQGQLEGIRQGNYKLLVKKPRVRKGKKALKNPPKPQVMLFDLSKDLGEQDNLAAAQPEVVTKLQQRMKELDAEITANARAPWTTQ